MADPASGATIKPSGKPKRLARWVVVLAIVVVVVSAAVYAFDRLIPPNTVNLFCTYDLTYRITATIEVGGRAYSAQVVRQEAHSRKWIATMNSAGCVPTHGTVLVYRLADDRLILLRAELCAAARQHFASSPNDYSDTRFVRAMAERRNINLIPVCNGIARDRSSVRTPDGFVIDHADRPARWKGFTFGDDLPPPGGAVRLIAASAEAGQRMPADQIDSLAPALLRTTFKYQEWSQSPEAIVAFTRRHDRSFTAEPY